MKLVYKPFGILCGLAAGFLSKKLFDVAWGIFDEEEPPKPTTEQAPWAKVLVAAAVEGITFKVTRAAVDRAAARSFERVTGVWPGEAQPEPSQAAQAVR
jgi:hypothetical protein